MVSIPVFPSGPLWITVTPAAETSWIGGTPSSPSFKSQSKRFFMYYSGTMKVPYSVLWVCSSYFRPGEDKITFTECTIKGHLSMLHNYIFIADTAITVRHLSQSNQRGTLKQEDRFCLTCGILSYI